jgi:uncharacterized membrane protein YfcA
MWDDVLLFVAVGFAAQIIDGSIGMAYGLTATTVLLSLGYPPVTASASIHAAEVFTTAASGLSHWRFGNVDSSILWRLALPGMIGGAVGAYLLTTVDGESIRPFINCYLGFMGLWILSRFFRRPPINTMAPRWIGMLGFGGGTLDAIGGGGWGPIVTTTLIGNGHAPRYSIGSVNAAEFFVTLTISATFVTTVGLDLWPIIAGLIVGGAIAAPLSAYVTQRVPDQPLMLVVSIVILLLSLRSLLLQIFG